MAKKSANRGSRPRKNTRNSRNTYTTKSGNSIKLNRNVAERVKSWRDTWKTQKALRLSGMPKTHLKRFLYRMRPDNLKKFWLSREGAMMALKIVGIGIISMFIVVVGLLAYLRKDIPNITNIYGQNLGGSINYYDRTGTTLLWQDYNAVKRVPVPGDQISSYMKSATVAIEDKNFYHEGAFDVGAIMRSAYHDVFSPGQGLYGGSTITQQLVKLNENWTNNRTVFRKIKEVIIASELEREYSKADILTGYLNIAPYGGVDYGVQTAAQDYFHEDATKLDLAQSAFLAAIPQSPDYYSPYSQDFNQGALAGREEYILKLMREQGYITSAQETAALNENVLAQVQPPQGKYNNIQAPYFVLAAKQQLQNQFGTSSVEQGGWKVITTLNIQQQNEANSLVAGNLANVGRYGGDSEAIVAENVPTGQVTALVGGTDFSNPTYGQINFATSLINPGSSYKLYDYTALINDNNNAGAGSVLYDTQQPLPGYPCTNKNVPLHGGNCLEDYDFKYPGPLTLRYALAGSRNVPAVKAMLINGEQKTISLSEQMGLVSGYNCYSDQALTQTTQCYGSAAIGDGSYLRLNEHVNGFSTDARLGTYIPQTLILKVTNASGKVIYNWTQPKGQQVVKPDAAYIVDNMLSDPRASYLPGSCSTTTCTQLYNGGYKFQRYNGWDIAVKTGTTNENYDGLMMAMTSQYAVGTWVGYHTRTKALVTGGMEYLTEPLARGFIQSVSTGKPQNWVQPTDIKTLPAYVVTNHVGIGSIEPSPSTDLYPSWYVQPATSNKSYTVDVVSGDLATSCTPPLAKKTISSGFSANTFSVDTFENGGSGTTSNGTYNTSQSDNVHQCSDTPPSIQLASNNSPPCNGNTCSFTANIGAGTHPLSSTNYPLKVNGLVDGNATTANCSFSPGVDTSSPPSGTTATCTFPYSGTGNHTFSAQVVDSVLYSGNSSGVTMNIPTNISVSPSSSGASVSWSSSSGDSYTVTGAGSGCQTSGSSCNINGLSPNTTYAIQVEDNSTGESSPTVSFTTSGQ